MLESVKNLVTDVVLGKYTMDVVFDIVHVVAIDALNELLWSLGAHTRNTVNYLLLIVDENEGGYLHARDRVLYRAFLLLLRVQDDKVAGDQTCYSLEDEANSECDLEHKALMQVLTGLRNRYE